MSPCDPRADLAIVRCCEWLGYAIPQSCFVAKKISGGITNMLYRVWLKEDLSAEEFSAPLQLIENLKNHGVGVRFFGPTCFCQVVDRQEERRVTRAASGLCKQTHYHFEGGQIDEWVLGRHITFEEVRQPEYARALAKHLAHFHLVKYQTALNQEHSLIRRLNYWMSKLSSNMTQVPVECTLLLSKYQADLNIFLQTYAVLDKSPVVQEVLCHNDLLAGNIIVTSNSPLGNGTRVDGTEQAIEFIDYEYASKGYNVYDIANHLTETAEEEWAYEHEESYVRNFVATYLEEINNVKEAAAQTTTTAASSPREDLDGLESWSSSRDSESLSKTEDDIDELVQLVYLVAPLTHYWWGVWGLAQAVNSADAAQTQPANFLQFAQTRYDRWSKTKQRITDESSRMRNLAAVE